MNAATRSGDTTAADVVVAGGGAAGLSVALALARLGMTSVVLERLDSSRAVDRGDVIHHGVTSHLRRWGVWERLEAAGICQFERFEILDAGGRALLSTGLPADVGQGVAFTSIRHHVIVDTLAAAAEGTGRVDVRRAENVTELVRRGGRVTGVVTARGRYRARLTVLAAGGWCSLRDEAVGRPLVVDYGTSFVNTVAPLDDRFARRGAYILGDGGLIVVAPLPGGIMRVGFQIRRGADQRLVPGALADRAAQVFRPFREADLELSDLHSYRLRSLLARSWAVPGCLVVGDAAHTTHPAGGQGMNLAFQDAAHLAALVASTGARSDGQLDRLVTTFGRTRRRQVLPVLARCHVMGLAAGWERPAATALRTGLVRSAQRCGPLRRAMVRRITEVR